jgi:hypothetical protein
VAGFSILKVAIVAGDEQRVIRILRKQVQAEAMLQLLNGK